MNSGSKHTASVVKQVIEARKTSKVLLPIELRTEQQALWKPEHLECVTEMLQCAAMAPFHKRADEAHCQDSLNAPMPWRFHVLDPQACNNLLEYLESRALAETQTQVEAKWSRAWQSKIKNMVAASGVLIQVTWLPDSPHEFNLKNIEHVAAAGAAVQNLLIAAQSHDWLSYWSSGGILRDEEVFDFLGINRREQLLGSVFLSPQSHPSARVIDGGLRDERGELDGWVRWVST